MKSTITEMENSLQGFKGRVGLVEEWTSRFEDKTVEIINFEENKEKMIEEN